jgi:hypothetical protein
LVRDASGKARFLTQEIGARPCPIASYGSQGCFDLHFADGPFRIA